jgi:hypothetical protein
VAIKTIKTLALELDGTRVECQLTRAALVDSPNTEELTTFCGTETSATPNYDLELAGFQDYGQADSVFDLIHQAYVAEQLTSGAGEIAFTVTAGTATRSGTAKPVADAPFGGDAGSALNGDITLDVVSPIVDGVVVLTGTAGTPGTWNATPPSNAADATTKAAVASPTTAWTTGQWVQGTTAGIGGEMHWDGTAWGAGKVA